MRQRHVFRRHDIFSIDGGDEFAGLLGTNGSVRHQQRFIRRRRRHAHPREHADREHAIGIGEHRAATDCARRAVDHIVDEVHSAFVGEVLLVDQLERDLGAGTAAGDIVIAAFGEALVAQIRRFIEGKFEADRIGRHDGREQRRVAAGTAGHEVALRHAAIANAAVDRRAQFGEFEIEFGCAERGFGAGDRRLRVAVGLRPLLESLVGDGLVTHELLTTREIGLGEGEIGFRGVQIGAGLVDRVLEWSLVDREQQVALLDRLAVLEGDGIEIARDTGAHLHRVHGDETSDIFVEVGHGALDRFGDGHCRGRWRGLLLRAVAATYD